MTAIKNYLLSAIGAIALLVACNNDDDNNNNVLQNTRRIECERRSPVCQGRDGLRFYLNIPRIQSDTANGITVTDVWSSFVVCCDLFPRLLDSLTIYSRLLDSALSQGRPFDKEDTVGSITIRVGFEYFGDWMKPKRWDWLSFGDGEFRWLLPTGEYFEEHKKELEEAYARCCL